MPSRDRRGAISAEVYNDEEIQNYKRIVVPKDYKTMQALQRVFENIKLLKSCDEGKLFIFSLKGQVWPQLRPFFVNPDINFIVTIC